MGNAVAPHSGVFGLNGPQSVDRQGVDPFDAANVLNDKGWLSDPRQFEPEPPAAEADLSFSVPTDASSTAALSAAALSAASPSWTPSDAAPSSAPAVRASSASADLKKKKRQASRRRKKKQKKSARAPAAGASAVPKEAAPASAHGGAPFVTTTTDGMVLLSRKLAGDRTIYIDCGPGGAMLRGGEGIAHRDMDNGNNHVDNLCSVREAEARKMLGAFAFVCDVCSASGEGVVLTRCGRCKARRYCGVACQRADWKRGKHKQVSARRRATCRTPGHPRLRTSVATPSITSFPRLYSHPVSLCVSYMYKTPLPLARYADRRRRAATGAP